MPDLRLSISDFNLNSEQTRRFVLYAAELVEWNTRMNISAIRTVDEIWSKHFCDSLSLLTMFKDEFPKSWIDVGTGGGFPGIPIKIMRPEIELTLVDSVGKKIDFCRNVLNLIGLKANVLTARAEDLGQDLVYREKYDCSCARAVAALPILCELLLPLTKVGGYMLVQKGSSAHEEINQAERALLVLGGALENIEKIHINGVKEDRFLIKIRKIKSTPIQYPRRVGMPSKRPL